MHMEMLRKFVTLFLTLGASIMMLSPLYNVTFAAKETEDFYKFPWEEIEGNSTKQPGEIINDNNSFIDELLKVLWVTILEGDTWNAKFLSYTKAIINKALWIVSLIALAMIIYTFYMMFISKNEDWVKKMKWNLIRIFIILAVLWLSWLIVSFIFHRYEKNWQSSDINQWITSILTSPYDL